MLVQTVTQVNTPPFSLVPHAVSELVERKLVSVGDRELDSQSSQINDLKNVYLSPPSPALGVNRL